MDIAGYEKIIIEDPDFPMIVLENDKPAHSHRQQLCPLHWHEHLELHYITEGTLEIWVNQTQHTLHSGDLLVIGPNDAHSSYSAGRLKERILIFRLEDLSKNLSQRVPGFQQVIRQDASIRSVMTAFDKEYTTRDLGYDVACKADLLQLVVYLARNYLHTPAADPRSDKHARQLQRLLPVKEYIDIHYRESIDSETLAALIYLSKDRFNHLFKEAMGIPLKKYINDIRLHSAKRWLEEGLYTPAEAAAMAGFTDYNHFGRLFRQTFGCTPSQILSKTAK